MQKCRKIITVSVIISMSFSSSSPAPNELNFIDCNVASMIAREFVISEMRYLFNQQHPFYKMKNLILITGSTEKSILWAMT